MKKILLFFCFSLLMIDCSDDSGMVPEPMSLFTISVNGITLVDGTINVATDATFRLVFSKSLDATAFENNFSLTSNTGSVNAISFNYTNASSAVEISTNLDPDTEYILSIAAAEIGQDNSRLENQFTRNFTTKADGFITEQPPCVAAGPDCLEEIVVDAEGLTGTFEFYSTLPLEQENTRWERIKTAVISVHGQNRDADQYFNHMNNAVGNIGIENEAIVISPFFKSADDAGATDLYWTNSTWRIGADDHSGKSASSFTVIDQILDRLADKDRFPVLENIVIAGHSSGATFVQTYAAGNLSEGNFPDFTFYYVVANSQYFYYPDDLRYDAGLMDFVPVSNCTAYNHWPMGSINTPPYLNSSSDALIDANLISRKVLYLLGTADTNTTGTLNTSDCEAVLLGEHRLDRGRKLFQLLEENHAGHASSTLEVNGIGHNAGQMFGSAVFTAWLEGVVE